MQNPPPYAPVATVHTPSFSRIHSSKNNASFNLNLNKPVQLYDDTTHPMREVYESLAEIYSIIVVLDQLEKSYLKDGPLIVKASPRDPSVNNNNDNNDNNKESNGGENSNSAVVDNYTPTVLRLLSQYNSLLKLPEVQAHFGPSLQHFKSNYKVNCPLATRRIEVGVPATMESSLLGIDQKQQQQQQQQQAAKGKANTEAENKDKSSSSNNNKAKGISSRAVAEATGGFITLMDALKLNYKAKDQLYPLLSDLITSINSVLGDDDDDDDDDDVDSSDSDADDESDGEQSDADNESALTKKKQNSSANKLDFEGRKKLVTWLVKLNNMKVDQELNDEDTRQFLFDLESAYKNFYTCLE